MSKDKRTRASRSGSDEVVVRAKRRSEPDLRRLARALIELARQELETEAAAVSETPSPDGEEAA